MPEGLTDAQIIERLERLERNVRTALAQSGDRMGAAKLYAERTGAGFIEAQRVVNSL